MPLALSLSEWLGVTELVAILTIFPSPCEQGSLYQKTLDQKMSEFQYSIPIDSLGLQGNLEMSYYYSLEQLLVLRQ